MEQAPLLVEPHFKGIVDCRDSTYLPLVYGTDGLGNKLEESAVLKLLDECPSIELVTDVRRAVAAALRAVDQRRMSEDKKTSPRLACHEGCPHRVGPYVYRGSQLMRTLWDAYVPEVKDELEPPLLDTYSDCTSREAERGFARLRQPGVIIAVTDAYQRDRSYDYLKTYRQPNQYAIVFTPDEIQQELSSDIDRSRRDFFAGVVDVVEARFSREKVYEREAKGERSYRALHAAGAIAKRLHLPDPERSLAAFLRSDQRLRQRLFDDGMYPLASAGGLPPRELDDGTYSDFFAEGTDGSCK